MMDERETQTYTYKIEAFNNYFNTNIDDRDADTIGGLMINMLEHLPKVGEEITTDGFVFRVTAADKRRVLALQVKPIVDV